MRSFTGRTLPGYSSPEIWAVTTIARRLVIFSDAECVWMTAA